jgi:hypothetical protein
MHLPRFRLGWSRRRKVIAGVVVVIAVLIGGTITIVKILNSPATGTITQVAVPTSQTTTTSNKPGSFSDKFLSFTFPSNLKVIASQKSVGYLDIVNLYSNDNDHTSEHVAISIMNEILANDSGVNYRRLHPEIYKESNTANMVIFVSIANGYEKTGYITRGNQLTSVSVTAPGSKDLSSNFAMIINSLKWK